MSEGNKAMPAFSFMDRFVPHILSGRKHHTIRAMRKDGRRAKPGQTCYLYNRQRHGGPKLGESPCTHVDDIYIRATIYASGHVETAEDYHIGHCGISIGEDALALDEMEFLAYHDGFDSLKEMLVCLLSMHKMPFHGTITYWKPLQ